MFLYFEKTLSISHTTLETCFISKVSLNVNVQWKIHRQALLIFVVTGGWQPAILDSTEKIFM